MLPRHPLHPDFRRHFYHKCLQLLKEYKSTPCVFSSNPEKLTGNLTKLQEGQEGERETQVEGNGHITCCLPAHCY